MLFSTKEQRAALQLLSVETTPKRLRSEIEWTIEERESKPALILFAR